MAFSNIRWASSHIAQFRASNDDGPYSSANRHVKHDPGAARIATLWCLQLEWLPVLYASLVERRSDNMASLTPCVAFCALVAVASALARCLTPAVEGRPSLLRLARVPFTLIGALGVFFAMMEGSRLLVLVASGTLGVGFALGCARCERAGCGADGHALTLASLAMGASSSLGMLAAWQSMAWGPSAILPCMVAALCAPLAALLRVDGLALLPERDGEVVDSTLLRRTVDGLARRRFASFALLGFGTGLMLTLFFSGIPEPIPDDLGWWAMLGVAALALMVALGSIRAHEPDPLSTFSLLMLVAVVAFFPINPGSYLNFRISIAFGLIWMTCLCCSTAAASAEIASFLRRAGARVPTSWCCPVSAGTLVGIALAVLLLEQFWFGPRALHAGGRVEIVTTCGVAVMALTYGCTNLVLGREQLRSAEFIARGRIRTDLAPEDIDSQGNVPGSGTASLRETCRAVALDYGLTPRELDVLILLAQGNSMARIQSELVISEGTANTHKRNVYRKLDVHSKQELIDMIARRGS
jgi:DNA-binding CsgD family transcriptional regulator